MWRTRRNKNKNTYNISTIFSYYIAILLCIVVPFIEEICEHNFSFVLAQQPKSGPDRLIVEVSRYTRLDTHRHTVGLLWTSGQLVEEAITCTTRKKLRRRTSISSAVFELAIPVFERPENNSLDGSATGNGMYDAYEYKLSFGTISSFDFPLCLMLK
jgi:hypothetical protein